MSDQAAINATSDGGEEGPAQVRRPWCFWLAVSLLLLGALFNILYLFNHCPIDLSEDESHYWEWSRHLDYGYYSKPPGIAWVIWAAVKIGGLFGITGDVASGGGAALMPVVRMPAVLFGIFSGLLSIFLARRIFRDDRASLAVIILSAAIPMFAVGSLLITIDSPMYLCWAATVFSLWRAIESTNLESRTTNHAVKWLYAAGAACALGMLFKPVLIAIPICAAIAAWADPTIRRTLKSWHTLAASTLILLSQIPVIIWNAQHGWVTFRHIAAQGGLGKSEEGNAAGNALRNLGQYVGGQAGGMGGIMFVLLVIAVIVACGKARQPSPSPNPTSGPAIRTRWIFLLSFTLPLWLFYFIMNFWKGTEPNWPAASYFTGMILLAGIFVEGWNSTQSTTRRNWRTWGTAAITLGFLLTAAAMNAQRFYPLAASNLPPPPPPAENGTAYFSSWWHPRRFWDQPTVRIRALQERAAIVEAVRAQLAADTGMEPLIITNRYDTSSSLAFYMPGQPFVYSIMSSVGGRWNQYDFWPGINQRGADGKLLFEGRPAVIVGAYDGDILKPAFEHIDPSLHLWIKYDGVTLKEVVIRRAYGFKGLPENRGEIY